MRNTYHFIDKPWSWASHHLRSPSLPPHLHSSYQFGSSPSCVHLPVCPWQIHRCPSSASIRVGQGDRRAFQGDFLSIRPSASSFRLPKTTGKRGVRNTTVEDQKRTTERGHAPLSVQAHPTTLWGITATERCFRFRKTPFCLRRTGIRLAFGEWQQNDFTRLRCSFQLDVERKRCLLYMPKKK